MAKLLLSEPESVELTARVARTRLASSTLAGVEVARAVRRVGPDPFALEVRRILSGFDSIAIGAAVLDHAARLDPPALGSFDAVHLASALTLGSALSAFITYDRRLAAAAEHAGLAVESPRGT